MLLGMQSSYISRKIWAGENLIVYKSFDAAGKKYSCVWTNTTKHKIAAEESASPVCLGEEKKFVGQTLIKTPFFTKSVKSRNYEL